MPATSDSVFERYMRELDQGLPHHYAEQSNRSADRMNYRPMVPARAFGGVIAALGTAAQSGSFSAYAVDKALRKVSPFFTDWQIMAGIHQAFGDVAREGWTDVAAATGPEAGRPSSHEHALTIRDRIALLAIAAECEYHLQLGHVPGPGWALKRAIQEHGMTVHSAYLPNVAKALQ